MSSNLQVIAGRYELGALIGAGGMGAVYLGVDTHSGETVAVKALRTEALANSGDTLERFLREGEALRRLDHPNIVKMLDTLEDGGTHYLIMEYISAGSLRDELEAEPQQPLARVLSIALDLADALTRAHRLEIVHRDIKPGNVLIGEDGAPRLADFGMAHTGSSNLTESGVALGTLGYLSPEACLGKNIDERADIWSLGVLLFEMLSGQLPFSGQQERPVMQAILTQPPPDLEALRPDIPVALVDLIYRMLEKDRNGRIPSVRLVGVELEMIAGAVESPAVATRRLDVSSTQHDTFAIPTPTGRVSSNLPAQSADFVGREDELAELLRLIDDPHTRLISILGPGGMGKTRLALQVGEHFASQDVPIQEAAFRNGVFLVELAPLSDPDSILPTLAETTGYQFQQDGRPLKQQILDFMRAKRMLLIVDNFEHLLDGAGLFAEILEQAPHVQVIVTTRQRLGLDGETVIDLGGMSFPERLTFEHALEYSAIKLFVQSAAHAQPGFELSPQDLPHIIRICHLVQGMPLGVLLAAAWIEILEPAAIAAEIERDLDVLATELRNVPERHRSIRAVFDYSWSLLNEAERSALMQLSIFRGGMSRIATQAVTGVSLRQLMALVNKSLLRRNIESGRYNIHKMLRQYAEEKLNDSGDSAAARQKHSAYYLAALAKREADLKGGNQLAALTDIDPDLENIRVAWGWALQGGDYAAIDKALESARLFCAMRSRIQERSELFGSVLRQLAPEVGAEPHPVWRHATVRASSFLSQRPEDVETFERCLAAARAEGDRAEAAYCLRELGNLSFVLRDLPAAVKWYEQSEVEYRALEDMYYQAQVLNRLGLCYGLMRQLDRYRDFGAKSYKLARQIGDEIGMGWALHSLGFAAMFTGRWQEAFAHYEEAHDIWQRAGHLQGKATAIASLAGLAYWLGDFERWLELLPPLFELAATINDAIAQGLVLISKSYNTMMFDRDYDTGRRLLQQAQPLVAAHPAFPLWTEIGLSVATCGLREWGAAQGHISRALQGAMQIAAIAWTPSCLAPAGMLLAGTGQRLRAVEIIALALTHPMSPKGWMERSPLLTDVRAELENELGAEAYQAAWERGTQRDLEASVQELIAEFGG